MLAGRQGERIGRLLAKLIETRLPRDAAFLIPPRLVALQLGKSALAPVRGWLMGEASCTADALAHAVSATCNATLRSLRAGLPPAMASQPRSLV